MSDRDTPAATGRFRAGGGRRSAAIPAVLLFLGFLPGLAPWAPAADFTGVRGWVSLNGEAIPGVTVYAFREYDGGLASEPVARSAPSPADGTYSLPLPPGIYTLVAARTEGRGLPDLREGDLFCYFGGNPVRVEPDRPTGIGLSLLRVGSDPAPSSPSGISGTVFDERGNPLAGATVYAYKGTAEGFKGMPGVFARTREDGTFQLRIRKGTFFLVSRKRESGEIFGPTLPGDSFGFYPRNPVALSEGEGKGVRIDAQPRQAAQEKLGDLYVPPSSIVLRAKATDATGQPVAGVRLLAYKSPSMTGFPAYVSARSGKDGALELSVAEEGTFYLLAREKLGGPADGEWYGRFAGSADHSVRISRGMAGPLTIVVERR